MIIIVFLLMFFNLSCLCFKFKKNRIEPKIVLSVNPMIVDVNGIIKIEAKSNYNSKIFFEYDKTVLQRINKNFFKTKKPGKTDIKVFQKETLLNKFSSEMISISIIKPIIYQNFLSEKEKNTQKIFNEIEKCFCEHSLSNKECGCKELPIIFNPELNENFIMNIGDEFNFEINAPTINKIMFEVSNNNIIFENVNKIQQVICNLKTISKGKTLLKIYCLGDHEYKYYLKQINITILPKHFEYKILFNENLFLRDHVMNLFYIYYKSEYKLHKENDIIYLDSDEIINFNYESTLNIQYEINNDNILIEKVNNLNFLIPQKNGSTKIKFFNEDTNEYDKIEQIFTIIIVKKIFPYMENIPIFHFDNQEEVLILGNYHHYTKKNKEMFIHELKDFSQIFINKLQHLHKNILDFEIINDEYEFKDKNCVKISNDKFKMTKCGIAKFNIKYNFDYKIYKKINLTIKVKCNSNFKQKKENNYENMFDNLSESEVEDN